MARRAYCEIVDDIEEMVSALSEEHGVPMRVAFNASRGYHVQIPRQGFGGGDGGRGRRGGGRTKSCWLTVRDLPRQFIQPQQLKGCLTFTTEAIVQADHRGKEALREISVMSNGVVQALLTEVRGRIGCLYKLSEMVATLDMVLSLTESSMRRGYVRPSFGHDTAVMDAKHPILDAGVGEVVGNDVVVTGESSFHVLTGANMAGKSTYLKMVVLLQVSYCCHF